MSKARPTPTQAELREMLHYNPDTGLWVWLRARKGMTAGDPAGSITGKGRRRMISINGIRHLAYRLAWLYMTGVMPDEQIDHINGIQTDDRFCNLRLATHAENGRNCSKRSRNRSGFKGVHFIPRTAKWQASIRYEGRTRHIGYFSTPEAAHAAFCSIARELYGEFFHA